MKMRASTIAHISILAIYSLLYPTQRVVEGIMFLTRPSVCQSVRQSCFACQHNSSETAQQNFLKLCSYEGHNVQMHISTGNLDSFFFLRVTLFLTQKDTTETVCQCNSSEATQQNFVKLCSYEGHNVLICIFTGNADLIFLRSNLYPF